MSREKSRRSGFMGGQRASRTAGARKAQARKLTQDGMEEQSENLGDAGREQFNIRIENKDAALGRATPRDASDSVHDRITKHQAQARKFTEHAAKPADKSSAGINGETPPFPRDYGETTIYTDTEYKYPFEDSLETRHKPSPAHNRRGKEKQRKTTEQPEDITAPRNGGRLDRPKDGGERLSHDSSYRQRIEEPRAGRTSVSRMSDIPAQNTKRSDAHVSTTPNRNKRGSAYQRRFEEFRPDKRETPQNTGAPQNTDTPHTEPLNKTERQPDYQSPQEQPQEFLPENQTPARTPPQEHIHRSAPDRPLRLRHDKPPSASNKPPKRRPVLPDAAKYKTPETVKASETVPAKPPGNAEKPPDLQPASEQPQAQQTIKQARDTALSHESTPRSVPKRPSRLRHGDIPAATEAAPRRQPASPDAARYTPTGNNKTEGVPVKDKAAPAQESGTEPVKSGAESVKPDVKPGKPGADRGAGTERSQTDKPGKLRFAEDEAASPADAAASEKSPLGRKLEKARSKAERSAEKLEEARGKLPKKHNIKIERTFDEKKGKSTRKLVFEEEVKSQRAHIKGPLITRPVKAGVNAAIVQGHRKLYQAEHENVGTEAAHKAEMFAESGIRVAYRMHKTAPYRKVERLTEKTTKLNMKASYRQALHDNPKLNSNIFSRMAQKRRIKKDYAKAAREAQKAGKRVKKAGTVIKKISEAAVRLVSSHPVVFGIIGAILLLVVVISSLFTSCTNMGSGIGGMITAASYLAQDEDVDSAELFYTEWETDLLSQIDNTETDRPGYDEYRYQVDNVGHNPYELMAYLTAVYHEFTYPDIEAALRQIFNEQYQLTFTPSVETRYADPADADGDGNYEPYDWKVLTITLTSRPFTEVIYPRMNTEQRQHYDFLMWSKGGRQYAGSPFDFNWMPYVTSYYGYRVHPVSGAKDYHKGIDIGVPTGTDIRAAHDGTVSVGYDAGGYGHYITLTGEDGLVTKYAHLDSAVAVNGQTVKAGDVIAKSGNSGNSTGPHLHYEVIKDGQYLNPLYFSTTNDNGGAPVYGYAGSPMGDGSYAALIEEAERYIGMPYRWGGSSPATSFDCSGYVSWVLTQSGVKNTGRLTAQGLYNICTPIQPSEAQPGDLIFFTGTYSAAVPVTHVGVYVGGGRMLHCGSPIGYASINTSYWQSHFYSFGRVN